MKCFESLSAEKSIIYYYNFIKVLAMHTLHRSGPLFIVVTLDTIV